MNAYTEFLTSKAPSSPSTGIEPSPIGDNLADFQRDATAFCLRKGRAALFLDTGLGKSRCQMEFSAQAGEASNGRSLILTPLAVARQMQTEAVSLGYDARVVRSAEDVRFGINICNYDRVDHLDMRAFGSISLDESSILKNLSGATTRKLIEQSSHARFRLCATATPAPNDHQELGSHAEFLDVMSSMEMLCRWFINDTSEASQAWRLKRHAEQDFWDWCASWAQMAETPADMGYDGSRYVLSPYHIISHKAQGVPVKAEEGSLFASIVSATSMHDLKRQTAEARADVIAGLVADEPDQSWLVWCDTDYEADALVARIPHAADVRGSHTVDTKENRLAAFCDGSARVLVTKPSIAGAGLNFQHCARMAFVGRSFSYEAWYQAVRRCWRFGQARELHVHIVVADGEDQIGRVITRKSDGHARMRRSMKLAMERARGRSAGRRVEYDPTFKMELPAWL